MQSYCDRCNESADHPISIVEDVELGALAADLGYRSVCEGCYDDLLVEAKEVKEHEADDRRAEHRVAAELHLRVVPADGEAADDALAEAVSESGAHVVLHERLEEGEVVRLASDDGRAEALGIVEEVWEGGDAVHAEIKIVEPNEEWARLVDELESRKDD